MLETVEQLLERSFAIALHLREEDAPGMAHALAAACELVLERGGQHVGIANGPEQPTDPRQLGRMSPSHSSPKTARRSFRLARARRVATRA